MTDVAQTNAATEVFFSYAHEDEELKAKLEDQLAILQRLGIVSSWDDRMIDAGSEWRAEIERRLNSAQVILLLVSADFLASDFCYGVEMQRAIERHDRGEARVIPVILRACLWKRAPFGKLQALPRDGKAITSWANIDEAFSNVAQGIEKAVKNLAPPNP
ncbi:MAG: toll/interleukin-1 receptor domain-containing protein [Pyrinomonadaceae bacterium]